MGITLFVPQLCFRGSSPSPSDTRTCRVWSNVVFEETHCGLVWIRRYVIPCTIQIRYLIAAISRSNKARVRRYMQDPTNFDVIRIYFFGLVFGKTLTSQSKMLGVCWGHVPCDTLWTCGTYRQLSMFAFIVLSILSVIGSNWCLSNCFKHEKACRIMRWWRIFQTQHKFEWTDCTQCV